MISPDIYIYEQANFSLLLSKLYMTEAPGQETSPTSRSGKRCSGFIICRRDGMTAAWLFIARGCPNPEMLLIYHRPLSARLSFMTMLMHSNFSWRGEGTNPVYRTPFHLSSYGLISASQNSEDCHEPRTPF